MLRQIQGQEHALSIIKHAIAMDKVAQCYLFHGPDGVGKFKTALYFAMALNCFASQDLKPCGVCPSCSKFLHFSHPDLTYVFPTPNLQLTLDGEIKATKFQGEYQEYMLNKQHTPWRQYFFSANTEIRRDSISMVQHRLSLSISEAKYRICIIEQPEMMNDNTANAFLKTMEEPPPRTIILLLSSKPAALLPTVLSRCQQVAFFPIPRKIIENELIQAHHYDLLTAKTCARIANGNLESAIALAEQTDNAPRQYAIRFLEIASIPDDLAFVEFLNEVRQIKSQSFLRDLFQFLLILIADFTYMRDCQSELVNIDQIALIEKVLSKNPELADQVININASLEKAIGRLVGNVNQTLILLSLYHDIKKAIYGK